MGPLELLLGAVALKALTDKPAPATTPPPKTDANAGGGGGSQDTAKAAGSLGATAVGGIISLLGGGSGAGAGTGITTTTAAIAPAASTGAGAAAEAGAVALPSGFVLSVGSVFTLAWAALFVLQFIIINALGNARIAWLRYRNGVYDLVRCPYAHLHNLERALVDQALDHLGLHSTITDADDRAVTGFQDVGRPDPAPDGPWTDPRLSMIVLEAFDGLQAGFTIRTHRQIYSNPFQGQPQAALKWRLLQLAARLVASRYVFDMARLARNMAQYFPGLGGRALSEPDPLSYWNYPLLGGGVPDKTYAGVLDELRAANVISPTIDDVLNAVRMAAIIHVASTIQQDPDIHFPWNPVAYAQQLYTAMGLDAAHYHVTLGDQNGQLGASWLFDVNFYKLPCSALWLDIDWLKHGGLGLQPFKPGTTTPESFQLTCLRALA